MIAGGMSQEIVMRAYAGGGEMYSGTELLELCALKRRDPKSAEMFKTAKAKEARAWHEARRAVKQAAKPEPWAVATDEQIFETEYMTALACGGMDEFAEQVLIQGKFDAYSEAAHVYGRSPKNTPQVPVTTPANHQPRRYGLLTVADLSAMSPSKYRVKNILPCEGIAAIFGPPGVAKSFLALDLAFTISDGDEWCGYRVKQCDVLYLCLEGQGGLAQRAQAYREHHGQDAGHRIRFITAPFSLLFQDDVGALVDTVKDVGIRGGVIMVDTLSAATAGADENSSVDMGRILEALKRIQAECGGLVTLIHHSGKDAGKGLRGHSSLLAALDAVIEVRRDEDRRSWRLAKAKDGVDGEEHSFRLSSVELGADEDGDPITSCVVVPEERAADSVRRVKVPASGNQRIVYELAGELLRQSSDYGKGGALPSRPCIRLDDLIAACRGRLTVDDRRVSERARAAVTGLVNKGCLILREGWIWVQ